MRINLIGAGNLATSLAHALILAGHEIAVVFSRTRGSAEKLALKVDAPATDDLENISKDADCTIVAVSDAALPTVAARLRTILPDALIVHTAGTMPIETIPNGRRGVFYPMQTFSRQRVVPFLHIPVFIEADTDRDLQLLSQLAASVSNQVIPLSGEKRKILHLAAVFCCNFANHCAAIADKILSDNGIPFNVMLPLINETTEKLNHCPPAEAQTGPAARNDQNVIKAHIDLLRQMGQPQLATLYQALSDSIISMTSSTH